MQTQKPKTYQAAPRKCDHCSKDLIDGHISMFLQHHSGYKEQINVGVWEHTIRHYGIFSFCSGKCLGKYFDIEAMKDRGNVNRGSEPMRPIVHHAYVPRKETPYHIIKRLNTHPEEKE